MKIARLTTVRLSLNVLVAGQEEYFRSKGHTYFLASGPDTHDFRDHYYTELPLVRRPNLVKDVLALIATYFWLRKIKPDILHTHTPKAGLVGMLAGFFAGVPVRIHTVAGLPWMETQGVLRKFYKLSERLTYFFATRVYPNSYGLKNFLIDEMPFFAKKLKVIGNGSSNGIDTDYFSIDAIVESKEDLRDYYSLPRDSFVWIFIGRIVKDKGINELIEAFLRIGSQHILLLVGPFENDQDPISQETSSLIKGNSNIRTYGFQNDVRPFIKLADCLVFPSYREGFPNVPMQAAAMGLPQICSDINGCNEIVIPGVNGVLVPPKDIEALSNTMSCLAEDKDLRLIMSQMSRDSIVGRFSTQKMWSFIEEEYKELYERITN